MNIFSILIPKHTLTYLNANDPLDQAVAFLLGATYTAIPVVDDQGRYVGIASEGDFLRAVMEHGRENLAKYKVADIVNKDEGAKVLNTVEKDEIMERILDRNFLCVVDDRDCFIGIITRKSSVPEELICISMYFWILMGRLRNRKRASSMVCCMRFRSLELQ